MPNASHPSHQPQQLNALKDTVIRNTRRDRTRRVALPVGHPIPKKASDTLCKSLLKLNKLHAACAMTLTYQGIWQHGLHGKFRPTASRGPAYARAV